MRSKNLKPKAEKSTASYLITESANGLFCHRCFFSCLLTLFVPAFSISQGWQSTFGTSTGGEQGYSIVEANDGGFVMNGTSGSNYSILMKVGSNGGPLMWAKKMYHCYNDFYGIQVNKTCWVSEDNAGGYILAGHDWKSVTAAPGPEMEMIHYLSNGTTFWNKTYGNNYDANWGGAVYFVEDMGFCAIQTADAGYIMAGYTEEADFTNNGERNVGLIKTNASGTLQWTLAFGGSTSWDESEDDETIYQTSTTEYIVAGTYRGLDMFLAKVSNAGGFLWEKRVSTAGTEVANVVYEAADGNYIIGGQGGSPTQLPVLVKITNAGVYQWSRKYTVTGGSSTVAYGMTKTADGGYAIVGKSIFGANQDAILIKTNNVGTTQWARRYGDSDADIGYDVKQTSDGGFIIGGTSTNRVYPIWPTTTPNAISDDFLFIKTNGSGVGDGSDEAAITVTDADALFAVAGITNDVNHVLFASTPAVCGSFGSAVANVFGAQRNGHPLPVDLLTFVGRYQNEIVHLGWATASEMNNDNFTIERNEARGEGEWETIGTVAGAGNSSIPKYYSFRDESPPTPLPGTIGGETVFYRLKQTDYNGHYEYFAPIAVALTSQEDIIVQTNTTGAQLLVSFPEGLEGKNCSVKIYDMSGRVTFASTFIPGKFKNDTWIDMSNVGMGIYVISAISENGISCRKKFIRQ